MVKNKGYCGKCGTKLKPAFQIVNGYVCPICHSVYLKDKIGRYRKDKIGRYRFYYYRFNYEVV